MSDSAHFDALFGDLPALPASPADVARWGQRGLDMCAGLHLAALALEPTAGIDETSRALLDARPELAWWAHLAGELKKKTQLSAELRPAITEKFLRRCDSAPTSVVRAGELLFRRMAFLGATTEECLFLCAAFAWPLYHVVPAAGRLALEYLGSAPWGVEIESLLCVVKYLEDSRRFGDIELTAWVDSLDSNGRPQAARAVLEAVAVFHADGDGPIERRTESSAFRFPEKKERSEAHALLRQLAERYLAAGDVGLHARALLQRLRDEEPGRIEVVEALEQRLWDAPFGELYHESVAAPERAAAFSESAWKAEQPYLGLRSLEARVGAVLQPPTFYNELKKGEQVLELLARRIPDANDGSFAPMAVEPTQQLVLRSIDLNRSTKAVRMLAQRTLDSTFFAGANGRLASDRKRIEAWLNETNPINIKLDQRRRCMERVGDDPDRRALILPWLDAVDGGSGNDDDPVVVLGPRRDQELAWGGTLVKLVDVTTASIETALSSITNDLQLVLGDLDPLLEEGRVCRTGADWRPSLRARAQAAEQGGAYMAGFAAGALGLVPGSALLAVVDVGATILFAFRTCARIGAVYGIDVRDSAGLALVLESLALGSGADPIDLSGRYSSLGLGGGAVSVARAAGALVASRKASALAGEQLVKGTARVLSLALSRKAAVKVIPVAGALLVAASTYGFVRAAAESMHTIGGREIALAPTLT